MQSVEEQTNSMLHDLDLTEIRKCREIVWKCLNREDIINKTFSKAVGAGLESKMETDFGLKSGGP